MMRRPNAAALLLASLFLVVLVPAVRAEEKTLLDVDWNDPELKSFSEERAAARAAAPGEESDLDKLRIPVLAFEQPPEAAARSARAGPEAEGPPKPVFDESNPVWYQISQDYGDVTVSIAADRRVQHTFDERSYPVYDDAAARAVLPEAEGPPEEGGGEEARDGYVVEYTVTKFGIPYTISVECLKESKEQCESRAQILRDAALLKVIGGQPQ